MASAVGVVLVGILLVVLFGSLESMSKYGLSFLFISEWNPVQDKYGAFTAIYGTLLTSFAALIISIPLGVGSVIPSGYLFNFGRFDKGYLLGIPFFGSSYRTHKIFI